MKTDNTKPITEATMPRIEMEQQGETDGQGWNDYPDETRIKKIARELSLEFRRQIVAKATALNVPSIKYKHQYLLEEVISDMEAFV